MKTFKNPFRALVELRNVGSNVVAAKVSTSMRLGALDLNYLSDYIVHSLLPLGIVYRRLYDGTYLLLSLDNKEVTESCIPSQVRSFDPLNADFELEDGLMHGVSIALNQSRDARRDYCFAQTRYLHLAGEISVDVCDDLSDGDTCEE